MKADQVASAARSDKRQSDGAETERDEAEHRSGAAVDLGEQPHHRGRMGWDRVGPDQRLSRPPEFERHPASAQRDVRIAPSGGLLLRPQLAHDPPGTQRNTCADYAVQMINEA